MRSLRSLPPRLSRHAVAVVALLAQLVAATGAPLPSHLPGANNKTGGVPFPCQNHPCGCATSEQGWAGDCCCFTLEEKLAWADARGITPPAHVRPAVESRKKAGKSCCSKKAAPACCDTANEPEQPGAKKTSVRWVAGMYVQKCRGEGFGGLLKLELIAVPEQAASPRPAFDPTGFVRAANARATFISFCPPTPPPRLV